MRAAYFRGHGLIEITQVPDPVPGPGEVVIRVALNGLCGSDRKALEAGHPRIPGHEVVGTVVAVGERGCLPIGTRVAVYIPLHCGTCVYCQKGQGNLCPHRQGLLGWSTDGGYAEYMRLPERNALPLAEGISFEQGVLLLDTLGTAGHGLRLAGYASCESALVIGAGPIGLGALAHLRAAGIPQMYVSEPSAYRRRLAETLGAIPIDPHAEDVATRVHERHPYGVDLVIEAVGSQATIFQAMDLVRPGGVISLVGEHWGPIALERPKSEWMLNDIHLVRSFYFPISEFYENQRAILEGRLHTEALVSHCFPLESLHAAYDLFVKGEAAKVLVAP